MKAKIIHILGQKKLQVAGSLLLLALFVIPIFALAGHEKKIYVDDDAKGTQNGSVNHPYKTIKKALKKADKNTEVHVRKGTYKENIEIPKGVEVIGSGSGKVTIKAKNNNEPTIRMNHKSKIDGVTIKNGRHGIKVGTNDKVTITNCVIKDNDKDGIRIREGEIQNKRKVSISGNEIIENGRSGIYSEKRRLVIIDNEIKNNNSDGVDIEGGSKVWLEGNRIKDNGGSGLKITLDGSEIWTKNNTYRGNEREGVEVNAYGGFGNIGLKKSKFYRNGRYGIAKIQRSNFSSEIWNGLFIQEKNTFWENSIGEIAPVIKIIE